MITIPTPHNEAKKGDIADYVIMPGDPLRAKHIAEKYLTDVVCYNKVRNMYGFTGYYKGIRLSIQASGMGTPSMGIYSKELYEGYDVDTIIRVGSAGSLLDSISMRDIVIATEVDTDSNYPSRVGISSEASLSASDDLLRIVSNYIEENKLENINIGKIFTSIIFYDDVNHLIDLSNKGYLAIEMETAALYANAKIANKSALSIFTVSDNPITNEALSSIERQENFDQMVEIALGIIVEKERNKND